MLRTCLIIAVNVLVVLSPTLSAGEAGWEKFTSKEARFSVSFAGKPKVTDRKTDNTVIVKSMEFSAPQGGVDYSVLYVAYAPEIAGKLNALEPKAFATSQRDATVKRTKGKVLSQKDVTLGKAKRPGYELLIQVGMNAFLRQRAFYVDGALYQTMIGGTREQVTGPLADQFQDSLQLPE